MKKTVALLFVAGLAACGDKPSLAPVAQAAAPKVIAVAAPLAWITPNAVGPEPPPRGRFVLRTTEFLSRGTLEVRQADRLLYTERCPRLIPNRTIHLGAAWLSAVRPADGPVIVIYN